MGLADVQARIEVLSKRLRKAPSPAPPRAVVAPPRAHRLERLAAEREEWERAIRMYRGEVAKVARYMGYCDETARKDIGDMGLWPLVEQVRRERAGQK